MRTPASQPLTFQFFGMMKHHLPTIIILRSKSNTDKQKLTTERHRVSKILERLEPVNTKRFLSFPLKGEKAGVQYRNTLQRENRTTS